MDEHTIAVNAAESTKNLAFESDPRNGIKVKSLASSALARLAGNIERCSDNFPNDELMQIVMYALPALKNIISSPRVRIHSKYEMVSQRNLRGFCPNTINWLSKRPGKTAREKIMSSTRVLAEKKIYSSECPENHALAYLMRHLHDAVADRITLAESDDFSEDTALYIAEFRQVYQSFKHSELSDVDTKLPVQANNVLISDRDYRKVWKAVFMLKAYLPEYNENEAVRRYAQASAMRLCARLFSSADILLCDKYGIWEPSDDSRTLFPLNFLVVCKDGERRYLTVDCIDTSVTVNSVLVAYVNDNGNVQISGRVKKGLQFEFSAVPQKQTNDIFKISVSVNNKEHEFKADYSHLTEITELLASMVGRLVECDFEPITENGKRQQNGIITADFTSYRSAVKCMEAISTTAYDFEDGEFMLPSERCLYGVLEHKVDTLGMLCLGISDSSASQKILEKISHDGGCSCFAYLVPDNINEFDQKTVRRQVSAYLNGFPIWRSVAAAKGIMDKILEKGKNSDLVVVDIDAEGCPITKLHHNSSRLEHFAPHEEDSNMHGINSIAEEYFAAFSKKYLGGILNDEGRRAILLTGKVNEMLEIDDESSSFEIVLNALNGLRTINVFLDPELLHDVVKSFVDRLEFLLKDYRNTSVLLICSSSYVRTCFSSFKNIITVDETELIDGAEKLAELYVSKRTPWLEHLPELDFIVPKDGRYCRFKLIGRDNRADAAVTEQNIRITENMVLPAGKKTYEFPLNLDSGLGGKSRINARLIDHSFPLKNDVTVKLEINYKYANEDTYELVFMPITENAPFKKITAEWVHDSDHTVDDERIDIPRKPFFEEQFAKSSEKIGIVIGKILKSLNILAERRRTYWFNFDYLRNDVSFLMRDLNSIIEHDYLNKQSEIDKIRNSAEAQMICDYYYDLAFEKHCYFDSDNFPEIFSDNSIKEKHKFMGNVVYSLMLLSMKPDCKYFEELIGFDMFGKFANKYKLTYRYFLAYNRSQTAWNACMEQIVNAKEHYQLSSAARLLSGLFWSNPDTLAVIYKIYPNVLEKICNLIKEQLNERLLKKKPADKTTMIRDYMELLLVVLSLRTRGFSRFKTGSREALDLADQIKLIDGCLAEAGTVLFKDKEINVHQDFCKKCRVKLDIERPEYLKLMSPLCYALTAYLNGESDGGSIRIESYADNDEN